MAWKIRLEASKCSKLRKNLRSALARRVVFEQEVGDVAEVIYRVDDDRLLVFDEFVVDLLEGHSKVGQPVDCRRQSLQVSYRYLVVHSLVVAAVLRGHRDLRKSK